MREKIGSSSKRVNLDSSVYSSTKPSIENAPSPERIEEGKEEHASPGSESSWGSGEVSPCYPMN